MKVYNIEARFAISRGGGMADTEVSKTSALQRRESSTLSRGTES